MFKKESKPKILKLNRHETDISIHLIPKIVGKSRVFKLNDDFIDIGIPDRYRSAKESI